MSQIHSALAALRRPKLLIRAARHGAAEYNRARILRRVLRKEALPSPERAVDTLLSVEAELERTRTARDGSYSAVRHLEVLIALIGEARLLKTEHLAA